MSKLPAGLLLTALALTGCASRGASLSARQSLATTNREQPPTFHFNGWYAGAAITGGVLKTGGTSNRCLMLNGRFVILRDDWSYNAQDGVVSGPKGEELARVGQNVTGDAGIDGWADRPSWCPATSAGIAIDDLKASG